MKSLKIYKNKFADGLRMEHSVITLLQNVQNLNPSPRLFHLFNFGCSLPPIERSKLNLNIRSLMDPPFPKCERNN